MVGWSIGEQMNADLVLGALNMALQQRRPEQVIHHSDQGSQYGVEQAVMLPAAISITTEPIAHSCPGQTDHTG